MENYTVYIHTNKINGKMYVGITGKKNPSYRWSGGNGYKHNKYFNNSIQKYGWDNFEHEIIASGLTEEEACNFEILLIDKLQLTNREYGYNASKGGKYTTNGIKRPEISKRNIENSKHVLQYDLSGNLIAEYTSVKEISIKYGYDSNYIRQNCIGLMCHAYGFLWVYKNNAKMLEHLITNVKANKHLKKVSKYDLSNNLLETYSSIHCASIENNVSDNYISRRCHGDICKRDKFIFKFTDDNEGKYECKSI